MKTLNGADLIKKRVEQLYSQYPEGSISKRDVLMTIPMDYDEVKIQAINSTITATIYQAADEFLKNQPAQKPKSQFSLIPKDLSYSDKKAECDAYMASLTAKVCGAVQASLTVGADSTTEITS